MKTLILLLLAWFLSLSVQAHITIPAQNGTMTITYGGQPGQIKITPESGELCVVGAEAVEIVITSPLLKFENATANPAREVILNVTPIRHPENYSETTAVQLSWHATGSYEDGTPDPSCNGSDVVLFNVTVTETPPPATVANVATPTTTPTDPVSLASGEFFFEEVPDLALGGPMPLAFSRYYASRLSASQTAPSPMGANWSHNFRFQLTPGANGQVTVVDNRGRTLEFAKSGAGFNLVSPTFAGYQLVASASGYLLGDTLEGRFYAFNTSGTLVSIQDRAGNTHTLVYTGGNLTEIADGLGRALDLTYDAQNRIVSVSDGTRTAQYSYAGGNLVSFTDVRGNVTHYDYDTTTGLAGLMTKKNRPLGNVVTAQVWDASGRVVSQADGAGNTMLFAYGADHSTVQTDPTGHTQQFRFDANGNLLASTDENGKTTTYTADASGRQASSKDSLGFQTVTSYDPSSGKPLSYTEPDGAVTTYAYASQLQAGITFRVLTNIVYPDGSAQSMTYDGNGNVTSFTDRAGQRSLVTYNLRGQVLTMTNPAGGVTSFTYNPDGTIHSIQDAAGNTTTMGYDPILRANLVTHPDGTTRHYTLDPEGHLLTDTDERGKTAQFVYDANGNLISITDPLGQKTAFAYDPLERVVSVTDPKGNRTTRAFDALGRVASRADRNGNTYRFSYDPASRLTGVTDPGGNVWTRTYDAEGFPLSSTDPLQQTWTYARDALARLTRSASPSQAPLQINYDQGGRVSSFTDASGVVTSFQTDPRGVLLGVSQGGGLIGNAFGRNELGLTTRWTDGNGQVWQHSYDPRGRPVTATDPLGAVTSMAYDAMNRVSHVTFPGGLGGLDLTYDGSGHLVRERFSDGTDLAFAFDDAGRLTSAMGLSLAYDAVGEITSANGIASARDPGDRVVSLTLAPGKAVTYAYDARDLVTNVTDWAGGVTTFQYDAAGRLTAMNRPNGVSASFSYSPEDFVTAIRESGATALSAIQLQRDGRGRVLSESRTVPLGPSLAADARASGIDSASQPATASYDALGRVLSDGLRRYSWDLASRLTGYTEGAEAVTFAYDAFGRRTARSRQGVTDEYVWNDALATPSVSTVRRGGKDLRYYVHSPGGALLYSLEAADGTRHFYHFDAAGNTLYLTDDRGQVTDAYAYSPYGVPLGRTGSTENPFTFAGQMGAMQETPDGLTYMRARYYDARGARFLSRDPARRSPAPAETNPYTFARGNPLLFSDPSGLSAEVHFDGVHTDFSVDVWKDGQLVGTLSASFGEGGYRANGGYGSVLWGGQGTFVLIFRPGQSVTQNTGADRKLIPGGHADDERVAQAILSSVDFSSINMPQYQAGTPAADFLLARLKEAGPTESGESRKALGFKTARGSGDWTSYGVIYPGRTCNTFTGTMLNLYWGEDNGTGVTAGDVEAVVQAHFAKLPKVRPFPGTENSGNLVIWMDRPE